MSSDPETVSSKTVAHGDLDQDSCQELCDGDPKNCWAYQIDLSINAQSKCIIFNEAEAMEGDGSRTSNCYLYTKSAEEI